MRHSAVSRYHWFSGRMSAEFSVRRLNNHAIPNPSYSNSHPCSSLRARERLARKWQQSSAPAVRSPRGGSRHPCIRSCHGKTRGTAGQFRGCIWHLVFAHSSSNQNSNWRIRSRERRRHLAAAWGLRCCPRRVNTGVAGLPVAEERGSAIESNQWRRRRLTLPSS